MVSNSVGELRGPLQDLKKRGACSPDGVAGLGPRQGSSLGYTVVCSIYTLEFLRPFSILSVFIVKL